METGVTNSREGPLQLIWQDAFEGNSLGSHWVGGHYNESLEGSIWVEDGLHVRFVAGTEYASAGVVTRLPVVGDFEARVQFDVESPAQGTTFELAAISVDPPRRSALDQAHADVYTRCRAYDVHGVPPYVSSEFDENNGWRIGWNRSTAQTRADANGALIADNHFNRYGADSGPAPTGSAQGSLRLMRVGADWTAYRLDADGGSWIQTGEVLQMNLAGPVFLRMAAKHWVKRTAGLTTAPANSVRFSNFELYG